MDFDRELGVKGYCLRGYKENAIVAARTRECGVDRIDLSRPQLDFRQVELHAPALEAYRAAGVKIVGIGVVALYGDELDRQYFEFCRQAGCRTVTISGEPATFQAALARAQRLADEYDMRLAIHNHGGTDWLGNARMLRHILASASDRVGLCLDTAWCIQAGADPVQWVKDFGSRVFAVHFKDFVFGRTGQPADVVVGEGSLDLPAFVRALQAVGFDGPAVIEYEADVDHPILALKQCVQKMRATFATMA